MKKTANPLIGLMEAVVNIEKQMAIYLHSDFFEQLMLKIINKDCYNYLKPNSILAID